MPRPLSGALGRAPAGPWTLSFDGYDEEHQRVQGALLALAAGGFGTSGGPLLARASSDRWVIASGIYDGDGPDTHLLCGPVLAGLAVDDADERLQRTLDLRCGIIHERFRSDSRAIELVRFVSLARPGIVAMRTRVPGAVRKDVGHLDALGAPECEQGAVGDASWVRVGGTYGGIVAATRELRGHHVVDDLAALAAGRPNAPAPQVALEKLDGATRAGFDVLLDEQRRAWEARWEDADIVVPADDDLQLAIRFALFHLMSSVPDTGEAAVGARGLTGAGYRGHVFWDADTFVLPFLAATHPASARAMLEYRINRIAAACENARALGRAGARFPWESAATGHDVTPQSAVDRTGHVVPILTGRLEEHIVADVAWAACQYVAWTGDEEFARGPGLTLLVETARYWASRVSIDRGGVAHVYEVIGPDEYHESVDDNAFTNVMARWNLERAAAAVDDDAVGLDHGVEPDEQASWRAVAAALVDGYDPDTRIHEQFAGFFSLEPLIISEVAPRRPIAADILLGADRTHGAQVIKQADVLMLHHLVPEAVPPESLEPDLNFYEPRTAHGSSLSPAVHAALLARLGRTSEALAALDLAARLDLDDLTGSTAAGLHLATMGGLWQALVFGFAGVRPRGGRLMIDPRLPSTWPEFKVRVRFHGVRVCIVIHEERVVFDADASLPIEIGGTSFVVGPGVVTLSRTAAGWELIS